MEVDTSFIVYGYRGTFPVSVTSTTDKQHADDLKEWLKAQGFRVSVSSFEVKRDGSQHK